MRVPLHVVRERRERLASLLRQHAYLPVHELCKRLDISEATVRRDLVSLAQNDQITRTFGGALAEFNQKFTPFRQRLKDSSDAKKTIAKAVARKVTAGSSIYLDAGSTVYLVAEEIARQGIQPLQIVTNSLPCAEHLVSVEGVEVHLPGGQWLPAQSILMGPAAVKAVSFYEIDLAIMGAEGIDSSGVWNSQRDVARFQRAILKRATKNLFCIDSTKLTHNAPEKLVGWDVVQQLVTDASPALLKKHSISLGGKLVSARPS